MRKAACEYCGTALPEGVDRETRRTRSFHFANCEARSRYFSEAQRASAQDLLDLKRSQLQSAGFTEKQAEILLEMFEDRDARK